MGSCYAGVCFDSCFDSICSFSSANHIRSSSIHYGWCDTGGCSSFRLFEPKISYFDSSVQRALFYFFIVHSFCALAHGSLLTLFCLLSSGFLTAILRYWPASQCLHLHFGYQHIFFTTLVQSCSDVWRSQLSVTTAGDSDEIVLCIGKRGSI